MPWNSRRYSLSGSLRRMPNLSAALDDEQAQAAHFERRRRNRATVRGVAPSIVTVTLPLCSSKTPAVAGPSGSTMSLAGSLPKGLAPSCSQNSPATVSQPPSRLQALLRAGGATAAISD